MSWSSHSCYATREDFRTSCTDIFFWMLENLKNSKPGVSEHLALQFWDVFSAGYAPNPNSFQIYQNNLKENM